MEITDKVIKSIREIKESADYIVDVIKTPDFIEVVYVMGGDYITDRVYQDGRVYTK